MIRLEHLRDLRLEPGDGAHAFVHAASGLVLRGDRVVVIADDSLSLANFSLRGQEAGSLRTLFPGSLPEDAGERKRRKPDLESLFEFTLGSGGRLLVALPSGSKPNRYRGASIGEGSVHELDFRELFARLRETIPALNIEGGSEVGSGFALFHRGNSAGAENAVIRLDRAVFEADLLTGKVSPKSLREITAMPLGEIDGVKLTFTDAAPDSRGRVWFLASAEATKDSYLDGAFSGAVLGRLDPELRRVEESHRIACTAKPEGLAFDPEDERTFYVVTDADDPGAVSGLFRGRLE